MLLQGRKFSRKTVKKNETPQCSCNTAPPYSRCIQQTGMGVQLNTATGKKVFSKESKNGGDGDFSRFPSFSVVDTFDFDVGLSPLFDGNIPGSAVIRYTACKIRISIHAVLQMMR